MKHIQLTLLIITFVKIRGDHNYFEYADCGETCTNQRTCCTISEEDGNFITSCCNSGDCRAREDNKVVCLCPGEAPMGGSDIWGEFHRIVHPVTTTPRPEIEGNCQVWKAVSAASWSVGGLLILVYTSRILIKRIRRPPQGFERIVSPDNPYQPNSTVQDIESVGD